MPIALAFACAIVYGVADYCGGRASRTATSASVNLIAQLTSLGCALVIGIAVGTAVPAWRDLSWGAVAGLAGAVGLVGLQKQ